MSPPGSIHTGGVFLYSVSTRRGRKGGHEWHGMAVGDEVRHRPLRGETQSREVAKEGHGSASLPMLPEPL
jgi:hypothetical protein